MTDPISQESADALMGVLTNLIAGANTPDMQQAQVLLLQRLALEGSVIPSRIAAPADITEVGGYINLLTTLGLDDMRTQMLGASLGLAGSLPLPGLGEPPPPLSLVLLANDQPGGERAVTATVTIRSDLAAGLAVALEAAHHAGGLLPLWSPPALPPAGALAVQNPLLHLGRAVLVAPTATTVDPQTDPVVIGKPNSDPGGGYRVAIRAQAGTPAASTEDWTCLMWDDPSSGYAAQTVTGATLLPLDSILAGSDLTAARIDSPPASRTDLAWAQLTAASGLIPGVTRLGDELALIYPAHTITASALAPIVNWVWNGGRFAPAPSTTPD